MNTHVNFDISKLLKEKGYNELCSKIYLDGELKDAWKKVNYDDTLPSAFYIAPTIADVVMWLYEKHGIWITADAGINGFYGHYKVNPIGTLTFYLKQGWINFEGNPFKTPLEAYSEAILYTLKNLI